MCIASMYDYITKFIGSAAKCARKVNYLVSHVMIFHICHNLVFLYLLWNIFVYVVYKLNTFVMYLKIFVYS